LVRQAMGRKKESRYDQQRLVVRIPFLVFAYPRSFCGLQAIDSRSCGTRCRPTTSSSGLGVPAACFGSAGHGWEEVACAMTYIKRLEAIG
jgi:hypothetical protein